MRDGNVLEHTDECRRRHPKELCTRIGGCYRCGATPWCQVIDSMAICRSCGADQDGDETLTIRERVERDLRAIKGIHVVDP